MIIIGARHDEYMLDADIVCAKFMVLSEDPYVAYQALKQITGVRKRAQIQGDTASERLAKIRDTCMKQLSNTTGDPTISFVAHSNVAEQDYNVGPH